jgi:hypothetical protein
VDDVAVTTRRDAQRDVIAGRAAEHSARPEVKAMHPGVDLAARSTRRVGHRGAEQLLQPAAERVCSQANVRMRSSHPLEESDRSERVVLGSWAELDERHYVRAP